MAEICVSHLVRAKNGLTPFERFIDSYLKYKGGVEHDLLFIFKGFHSKKSISDYSKLLRNIPHKKYVVSDIGFDLVPYFKVANKYNYRYFCFLNSFSIILDKDWLLKLYKVIQQSFVGVAGATGSWESHYTNVLGMPAIRENIPIAGRVIHVPIAIRNLHANIIRRFLEKKYGTQYDPFPNYHIRTNGFVISRDLMMSIKLSKICTKNDVHRFESGKNSLTKQVLRRNLKVLVVGRDGTCYEKEDWDKSNTFWQGDQGNLLIADNQTRRYSNGNVNMKQALSASAWGVSAIKG
ncbi:MAG: hypothetical protein HZA60_00940 [Deltaproteobacteria bacterium]|nr:hypothetical protein [Deltaproteobacteria bacterium]